VTYYLCNFWHPAIYLLSPLVSFDVKITDISPKHPAGGAAGAGDGAADGGDGGGAGAGRRRARRKREVTDERQARRK
jgi:hypothetical protein